MIKTKKQMFIVIGAFALVLLLGTTTYAFFNYTRTGASNIIKTGRIYFNSEQGTAINLTNLFPIDTTETGIMDDTTKVGTVTINVEGDTTYTDGIEYKVSAVNVQNTVGSKSVPISIQVSVENNNENDPSTSLGTSDADYFTNRGPSASTSIYKVLAKDVIENNQELVVGYIESGQEGVDGNIVIKAYIDKNKVAISDTYPASSGYIFNENLTSEELSVCLYYIDEVYRRTGGRARAFATNICNGESYEGISFQQMLDDNYFTSEDLLYLDNNNIIIWQGYSNGTPANFGEGRTVLTTEEWNSLQTNGVSFQVKVESNEGIWVEEPSNGTIESCPNCKFIYTTDSLWTTWNTASETPTEITSGYSENYNDIVTSSGKNYFLGVKLNSNNEVTNAYVCGVKEGVPFCIEGTSDGSKNSANQTLLQGANLYNNSCIVDTSEGDTKCGPWDNSGPVSADVVFLGSVEAGVGDGDLCQVASYGLFGCYESGAVDPGAGVVH